MYRPSAAQFHTDSSLAVYDLPLSETATSSLQPFSSIEQMKTKAAKALWLIQASVHRERPERPELLRSFGRRPSGHFVGSK